MKRSIVDTLIGYIILAAWFILFLIGFHLAYANAATAV